MVQLSFISKQVPCGQFTTDACTNSGGGAYGSDWFYSNWKIDFPDVADLHINLKELFTIYLSANRWKNAWLGKHIVIYSDNMATVYMINKGTSRNATAMLWLHQLFWLSACFNFHITAKHVVDIENVVSDRLFRLDQFSVLNWYRFLLSNGLNTSTILHHMSYNTLCHLCKECG